MKIILASSALIAAALPPVAFADGLSFGGNLGVTSNYISDGLSQSDGKPAIQPFFEISQNGFYGNVWASNIRDEDANTGALDLSAGYRGDAATGLSYDLGYTQHLFSKTHAYDADIDGALDYALTEQLTLSGELSYDLGANRLGEMLGAAFDLGSSWSINGDIGRTDPQAPLVVGLGVGYALNDKLNLDLRYEDTASTNRVAALTLNYAFGNGAN